MHGWLRACPAFMRDASVNRGRPTRYPCRFFTLMLLSFKPWKRQSLLPWLLLLCLSLLTGGCSLNHKQSSFDPKGPVAQVQYDLFMITVWVTLFIFVTVGGALLWTVIRYRERPGDADKPLPAQGHGNPLVEISLIAASVLLLVIIAVPTLQAIWYTYEEPDDPEGHLASWYVPAIRDHPDYQQLAVSPDDHDRVLVVKATGYQWWWSFEYPQLGITTANEFTIPVGRPVRIELRSADVIHSFWLPKLAGKVDLMPGRQNHMWLQADEAGHYYGQCAEFCGEAHAYMYFRADAVSEADFIDWVAKYQNGAPAPGGFEAEATAENPEPGPQQDWAAWGQLAREEGHFDDPVQEGARLFMYKANCLMCHKIDNSPARGIRGPDLTRIGARKSLAAGIMDNTGADGLTLDPERQHANLVDWIKNSHEIKPGNLMYYGDDAFGAIMANLEEKGDPLTDEEIDRIATYLQTLK